MKYKSKLCLLGILLASGLVCFPLTGTMADEGSGNIESNSARESALKFTTQLFDGMGDITRYTVESYKHCQRYPDSEECVQKRVAQMRNVENSLQMLNALTNSAAMNQLQTKRGNVSRIEELRELNQMCTTEPDSFVCKFLNDAIQSKISRKNSKVDISGIEGPRDY